MLSQEELNKYIAQIPPLPQVLKACKVALNEGDLTKAADLASEDKALIGYFKNIVNKPIFGFTGEISNARQIFGVLGLLRVRQLFQSYYSSLISPKQWDIFKLSTPQFHDLQASFIIKWETILKEKDMHNKEMAAVVTLIPAAVAVCENLFKEHKDTVMLIKSQKAITYEAILYKMSGYTFFDIVVIIAQKWEFSEEIIGLLKIINTLKDKGEFDENEEMMIYLILLINYEISRPVAMQSGINDLFELDFSYPAQMVEFFYEAMEKVEE